jgi:plastocyanin
MEADAMKRFARLTATMLVATSFVITTARADNDHDNRISVTVSFGAGLNTAQAGNKVNHQILPSRIRVRKGGVVNFIVGGFHQIMVYNRGTKPSDIAVPSTGLLINDSNNLYYTGISPIDPPAAGVNTSNAFNRAESVSFAEPGMYLVICNVRPHFLDGMYAWVRVDD